MLELASLAIAIFMFVNYNLFGILLVAVCRSEDILTDKDFYNSDKAMHVWTVSKNFDRILSVAVTIFMLYVICKLYYAINRFFS